MESIKISFSLIDRAALHNHYLPMVKGGGLFVPTKENLNFGDRVQIQVELLSEKQKASVPGRVIWITPSGAVRSLIQGVGIQIVGEHQSRIQQYFEGLLGDNLLQAPPRPCY
ncbi:MAG: hypothetical protein RLZZ215_2254 [Pseudomonadota bacterium]|jgi:type IV pilus assembly protein PilZ